jgi:hypothetical protein
LVSEIKSAFFHESRFVWGCLPEVKDSEKTSDAEDDEQASQATSVASSGSGESKVSLGYDSEDGKPPLKRTHAKRMYRARAGSKKPSISLDRVMPVKGVTVCIRAGMFLLGVSWPVISLGLFWGQYVYYIECYW